MVVVPTIFSTKGYEQRNNDCSPVLNAPDLSYLPYLSIASDPDWDSSPCHDMLIYFALGLLWLYSIHDLDLHCSVTHGSDLP